MGNESPGSIFDEAARKNSLSKKKYSTKKTSQIQTKNKEISSLSESEIQALLDKVSRQREELLLKLDMIQQTKGINLKEMKNFMDNPLNFKKSEWEFLQKQRTEMEEKLSALIGKELKEKNQKQNLQKSEKAHKLKSLGSRKKWIFIR